jgi:DNA adenine methylase
MIKIPDGQPFKWIGGKKWLEKELNNHFKIVLNSALKTNKEIIYIEPFCGGLGAFKSILHLLIEFNVKKIILNDINTAIIYTLKALKENFNELSLEYKKMEENFSKLISVEIQQYHPTNDKLELKIKLKDAEKEFNRLKKEFNSLKDSENYLMVAALFLFLMKHCFNGIYRENSKGEFNTPFNWVNKPVDIDNRLLKLKEYHELFNDLDIVFENKDVFELLKEKKDFNKIVLYLDPPYLNENNDENKYNKDVFNKEKQISLLEILKNYHYFLYSNHLLPIFEEYFSQDNHNFDIVLRKNVISGKGENRGILFKEILGTKII